MANVKVKMNSAGAREILNSKGVQQDLLSRAQRIKGRADSFGTGKFDADVRPGKNRAHAMVKTKPGKSRAAVLSRKTNAKHNALVKSIDAGRG